SSAFVKKQCKTEYALFASTLRRKHLTIDQLRYLHNSVLIPRIEYRLKATLLTEKDCWSIMAPFKNVAHVTRSLPDGFLHSRDALNIMDIFARHLSNHVGMFAKSIDSDNILKDIMDIRLANLQSSLCLPFSPLILEIEEFDVFKFTKQFRHDLIFRLIYFSSKLGIRFARPLRDSRNVGDTPLFTLFKDDSGLFARSLKM